METMNLHHRLVRVLVRAKKRREWVEEMAKLPHKEWLEMAMELKKQKKIKAIAAVARQRLLNRGFIKLETGSAWSWIEQEWFDRAVRERVIEYLPPVPNTDYYGKPLKGTWVPICEEKEEQVQVGTRGRNQPIYEVQLVKDFSRFHNFENQYAKWKESQGKKYVQGMSTKEIQEMFDL